MTQTEARSRTASACNTERLRITEIFRSLQGEARDTGWPTSFIRLTGCPLRCSYCDTEYAFKGGQWWSLDAILAEVVGQGAKHVCVTGGEPLAQPASLQLLKRLCDAGYEVSLETSGALDIAAVDPRVTRIVDIKTPASGEQDKNRWENLPALTSKDQIKFVIGDRADYEWSINIINKHKLIYICEVIFSPVYETLKPAQLADWILEDKLPVRFQIQLHKHLWGDTPGR